MGYFASEPGMLKAKVQPRLNEEWRLFEIGKKINRKRVEDRVLELSSTAATKNVKHQLSLVQMMYLYG